MPHCYSWLIFQQFWESHLIMVLILLYLHYLILSQNSASVMGTSGCAAIRFTIWTNSRPQICTFNNKQLYIKTDSCEEVFIWIVRFVVTKVEGSVIWKTWVFMMLEVIVKAKKKPVKITFLVRLRHQVSSVFNLRKFWQCSISSSKRQALIQFTRKTQLPFFFQMIYSKHINYSQKSVNR